LLDFEFKGWVAMPVVSIIVPVYCVEDYICKCVESVLDQTYCDYEVILVDDGSPDSCGTICDEYASKDNRIRVIHKENGGLSSARNAGLDIATGKYVLFLDSDDTITPNLLEFVIPHLEERHDLVAFGFRRFYDDGSIMPYVPREKGCWVLESETERKDFIHKILVQGRIGWEAWSRVFRRDIIEKYDLRFADNRKIFAEDLYFSLCYCAHAKRILSLDSCLYHYRLRRDSIMGQDARKNNVSRIDKLAQAVLEHYKSCDDCKMLAEDFQFLYFQIMMNQLIYRITLASDHAQFLEELAGLSEWCKIRETIQYQMANKRKLAKYYPPLRYFELIRNAEFLLGGSPRVLVISNWIVCKIRNQKERLYIIRDRLKRNI